MLFQNDWRSRFFEKKNLRPRRGISSLARNPPLAENGWVDMTTIVLAEKRSQLPYSQVERSPGTRKHMVRYLIGYTQDKNVNLVNGFTLAR